MAGYTVIESGNYDLEIDTGYLWDGFTLDDTTKGVLNNTDYVLTGTTQYASVMNGTMSLNAKRGRRDIGDQFTFGTMNFVLNDTLAGGVFNPFDTNSPYYNPANNQPGLAPLRKVRFSRYNNAGVKKYLWVGYIVNYDYTYNLGGVDTIAVNCADAFYLLAQTYLAEWNVTEELSGTRIANLLALPEVAYTGTKTLDAGTTTLGGSAAYKVANGTSAATYANQINTAEQGRVFINRDGTFVFENRVGNTLSGSSADFHDDGTAIPYQGVDISFQADQVKNRASVTHAGAASPQVADDVASQAKYLIQTISIGDSLLHDDASALTLAQYLIVGKPAARFNYLDAKFAAMTTTQKDTVALVDVGDTITIQKQVKTGSSTSTQLAQQLSVEGLEHRLTLSGGHEVSYYTAPTTIVYQLVLNDSVYGIIDSTNVLG
jgi:hypothetical protein